MKFLYIFVVIMIFISGCVVPTAQNCPPGYRWDASRYVCIQAQKPVPQQPKCDLSSENNIDIAVERAIQCVKNKPNTFKRVFADLITTAKKNPDIDNGEKILKLIEKVAIEAPYVERKTAKKMWNAYFSPLFFSSVGYLYEPVLNYCSYQNKISREIDEELLLKKIGILECMADQVNKEESAAMYRQAEEIAHSLKNSLNALCSACCENNGKLR